MIAHARQRLGLDRPVWVRDLYYMRNALADDFGRSMVNGKPVIEDIRKFVARHPGQRHPLPQLPGEAAMDNLVVAAYRAKGLSG